MAWGSDLTADLQINLSQFLERFLQIISFKRFAVPAIFIFQKRDTFAFDGFGDNHRWPMVVSSLFDFNIGFINFCYIMAVWQNNCFPAKRAESFFIRP